MKDFNYPIILPHGFKAVGLVFAVISALVLIVLKLSAANLSLLCIHVLISVFILGLLLFALSREKNEDEMVVRARYVSMMHSIVIGVFIAIIATPLLSFRGINDVLGYQGLALSVLVIYIVDFKWFVIKSKHEK